MESVYLFPLNQSLTLNKIPLPYHIFEPKYKKMINDALDKNKRICVIPSQDKYKDLTCIAGIPVLLQKYEDERMDIVITGVQKVKLISEIKNDPYLEYEFEQVYESQRIEKKEDFQLIKELLYSKLKKQPHFDSQKEQFDKILEDSEAVINYSTLLLLSDINDKYCIMQKNQFDQKIEALIDFLQPKEINIFEHLNLLNNTEED